MEQPACYGSNKRTCLSGEDLKKLSQSKVPIPVNEALRIFTLQATEVLDTDTSEPSFDRFVALSQRIFDVPIALVSLVDIDRQWFKANVGLEHVSQTHRDLAFCACKFSLFSANDFKQRDNVLGTTFFSFDDRYCST